MVPPPILMKIGGLLGASPLPGSLHSQGASACGHLGDGLQSEVHTAQAERGDPSSRPDTETTALCHLIAQCVCGCGVHTGDRSIGTLAGGGCGEVSDPLLYVE